MAWTRERPGAGDTGSLLTAASMRTRLAENLTTRTLAELSRTDASVAALSAETITALRGVLVAVRPDVQRLIDQLTAHAAALGQYAIEIDAIRAESEALARQEAEVRSTLRGLALELQALSWQTAPVTGFPPGAQALAREQERTSLHGQTRVAEEDLAALDRQRDALVERRRLADQTCSNRFAASAGGLAALSAAIAAPVPDGATLVTLLSGMTAAQISAYFQAHPESTNLLRTLTLEQAAAFWQTIGNPDGTRSAAQLTLITTLPLVVGNLNGIRLSDRVAANRLNLTDAIADLTTRISDAERAGDTETARKLREERDYYLELRDGTVIFHDPVTGQDVSQTGHTILAFDPTFDVIAEYSGFLDPVTGGIPEHIRALGLYVPGTGTTMAGFAAEVKHSDLLVQYATNPGTVGMITWKGGPFPQFLDAADGALARDRGANLAAFWQGVTPPANTETTLVGYSFGGAIVGNAEQLGIEVDRVLYVAGAGLGYDIDGLAGFPNTSDAPHYAMMAPGDLVVGKIQDVHGELFGTELGHGASPLTADGVIRLETGYNIAGDQSSGLITGHFDVWLEEGTAFRQIRGVIEGGDVELYAEPKLVTVATVPGPNGPANIRMYSDQPIMEPDYEPRYEDVEGGIR